MACILYDKNGNEQRVKAEYVSGMLMRGYTSEIKPKVVEKPAVEKKSKKDEKPLSLNLES